MLAVRRARFLCLWTPLKNSVVIWPVHATHTKSTNAHNHNVLAQTYSHKHVFVAHMFYQLLITQNKVTPCLMSISWGTQGGDCSNSIATAWWYMPVFFSMFQVKSWEAETGTNDKVSFKTARMCIFNACVPAWKKTQFWMVPTKT